MISRNSHKSLFPFLCLLIIIILKFPHEGHAQIFFSEDWDSGTPPTDWPCKNFPNAVTTATFNGWHGRDFLVDNSPFDGGKLSGLSTSIYHSAPRSYYQHRPANDYWTCDITKDIPQPYPTKIHLRFYVYFTNNWLGADNPPASSYENVHFIFTNSALSATGFRFDIVDHVSDAYPYECNNEQAFSGIYFLIGDYGTHGKRGTAPYDCYNLRENLNRWQCVEFMVDAANDRYSHWIDGDLKVNNASTPVTQADFTSIIISGFSSFLRDYTGDFYIDDIIVADSYIGCGNSDNTPPPSSSSGGDSGGGSGGSGCGFVKDDGKGQKAKGDGLALMVMLIIILLSKTRYRRLLMRKSSAFFLAGALLFLNVNISHAAVNLPWSTTYNCPEWKQTDGNPNCDGLTEYGAWTTNDGKEEQITTAANYPGGAGGKGQRHWLGDGSANNSGGTRIVFTSPQSELWIRWYMRFQQDFAWSSLQNFKILYINVGQPSAVIPRFYGWDSMNVATTCSPQNYPSPQGTGWNSVIAANGAIDANGNRKSDGHWHMYEVHIKMDTNGSDGIAEMWIDGVRILSYSNACFGTQGGWSTIVIGENHAYSANGSAYYVDYDDISISGIATTSGGSSSGSGNGGDASASGGSGCGFVRDAGKEQKAKGGAATFAILLIITLAGISLAKRVLDISIK